MKILNNVLYIDNPPLVPSHVDLRSYPGKPSHLRLTVDEKHFLMHLICDSSRNPVESYVSHLSYTRRSASNLEWHLHASANSASAKHCLGWLNYNDEPLARIDDGMLRLFRFLLGDNYNNSFRFNEGSRLDEAKIMVARCDINLLVDVIREKFNQAGDFSEEIANLFVSGFKEKSARCIAAASGRRLSIVFSFIQSNGKRTITVDFDEDAISGYYYFVQATISFELRKLAKDYELGSANECFTIRADDIPVTEIRNIAVAPESLSTISSGINPPSRFELRISTRQLAILAYWAKNIRIL